MHDLDSTFKPGGEPERFGYEVMGPVLLECCHRLHHYLLSVPNPSVSCALFCSRGGLIIRQAYEQFLLHSGLSSPIELGNLMISRLAAARIAFVREPRQLDELLQLEFSGKDYAFVASALSGNAVSSTGPWAQAYAPQGFDELLANDELGGELCEAIKQQAQLLTEHIEKLAGKNRALVIVDTGVFGSIGKFLESGLPDYCWKSVLLFRANYKQLPMASVPDAIGLICDDEPYQPWQPRSVSRLYWPFIESFFEPSIPSVKTFSRDSSGAVIANSQVKDWQNSLEPEKQSIRYGAFQYLRRTQVRTAKSIRVDADIAWKVLRKKIVYPREQDLSLLGVQGRALDFGSDECVNFEVESVMKNSGLLAKVRSARNSVWPEGAIRVLFPVTAPIWHLCLEAGRLARVVSRNLVRLVSPSSRQPPRA